MSSLRRVLPAYVLFAILLLTIAAPEGHASASTSIRDLQYPYHVVLSASTFAKGIPVTFTVSWAGASAGYALALGIDNAARTINSTEIKNIRESGQETARFIVQLRSPNIYFLAAWVTLIDNHNKLLTESESRQKFSFDATNTLQLTVNVPTGVTVTVDGTSYPWSISLLAGTHQILVPDMVPIDNMTRLRFDHWADGSTDASRTVTLNDDTQFEAIYVKLFLLTVTSPYGNAAGTGWYDEGSSAIFSVVAIQPMSGLFGLLGGKYVFDHWSGDSTATTPTVSVTIDGPKTVVAQWHADKTIPYILLATIAIVVVLLCWLEGSDTRIRHDANPSDMPPTMDDQTSPPQ